MRGVYYIVIILGFSIYLFSNLIDKLKLKEETLFIKNIIYLYKLDNKNVPSFLNKEINKNIFINYKKINNDDFLLITKTDSSRCSVDSRNIIRCEIIL